MKSEDTKNHILDTAAEMFWRQSYHGVNMNALSAAAGLNKATIYQYFPSKEVLAVAAVERSMQKTEDYVYKPSLDVAVDPVQRLKDIYQRAFEMQQSTHLAEGQCRGCPFVNLGMELATSSEAIRRAVARAFERFATYYAGLVPAINAARPGSARSEDRQIVAALVANMNGAQVAAKIENRPEAILEGQARALRIVGL